MTNYKNKYTLDLFSLG